MPAKAIPIVAQVAAGIVMVGGAGSTFAVALWILQRVWH